VNCCELPWPTAKLLKEAVDEPKTKVIKGKAAPTTMLPVSATTYKRMSRRSAYWKIR